MSVTKRYRVKNGKKTPYYQAEVYHDGVRVACQSFDTKAAAHVWHDAERKRAAAGAVKFTLAEVLAKYEEVHLPTVSSATAQTVRRKLKYVSTSPIAHLSMDEVTAKTIDSWLDWLVQQDTKDTKWRVSFKNEVIQLSVVFNWWRNMCDERFINPIVRRHFQRAVYKKVEPRRPDHFIRAEDILPWLEQLKALEEPVYYQLAAFQILTGCRIGEVMGLCWDALDLERRTVRIFRTASVDETTKQTIIRNQTKTTTSNRFLRLPPDLVAMLSDILPGPTYRMDNGQDVRPVFNLLDGSLPKYTLVKHYYKQGFKKLGLPWTGTHIARHSWATLGLMANGGNTASVQAALGHKSPEMTMRYAKVVSLMADATADKVAAMIHGEDHGGVSEKPKLQVIQGG